MPSTECFCCVRELKLVQVLVGTNNQRPDCLYLGSPIPDDTTLIAFRSLSETHAIDNTEFHFRLPAMEARVFAELVKHMNGEEVRGDLDTGSYNPETHVSAWCVLYVLATRFNLPVLAKGAESNYRRCRGPHWEGCWLPLPSEIKYLYEAGLPNGELDFLMNHLLGIFSATSLSTSLESLSCLLGHEKFRLDYLRAQRAHISMPNISTDCAMEDCQIHSPWMRLDTSSPEVELSDVQPAELEGDFQLF